MMRIVLATHSFASVGGSETYILTVAEQLQRLGHGVTVHTAEAGPVAELARARGVPVAETEDELPADCDAVLAQDAGMAHALAGRYPTAPQILRAASDLHDLQLPPMVPGPCRLVVVVSDRVARRIHALDPAYEVVRLRQPIDTERLAPLGPPRARPRRALLLGNYQNSQRRRMIEDAWGAHGVECTVAGVHGSPLLEPAPAIAEADIVVGKGRAVLDGMSCGRPVYVCDDFGTDGWVTPARYPALEADGFAGQATAATASRAGIEADLAAYDPEMGLANRELALAHHGARTHAHQLVSLLRQLAPEARPAATASREIARNVRLRWAAERQLVHLRALEFEAADRQLASDRERTELERQLAATRSLGEAAEARALAAEARLWEVLGLRRVRWGLAVGRVMDRARRLAGR